jgi:hypothetical protein
MIGEDCDKLVFETEHLLSPALRIDVFDDT